MSVRHLRCAAFLALLLPLSATAEEPAKDMALRLGWDIVTLPDDSQPSGLSIGGEFYGNNVAGSIGFGFGATEETDYNISGPDTEIGLDTYFQGLVKFGEFSRESHTAYFLVGVESYTPTFNGTAANDSIGDISYGLGATIGNPRFGSGGIGLEYAIIQDSDPAIDDISRLSITFMF